MPDYLKWPTKELEEMVNKYKIEIHALQGGTRKNNGAVDETLIQQLTLTLKGMEDALTARKK